VSLSFPVIHKELTRAPAHTCRISIDNVSWYDVCGGQVDPKQRTVGSPCWPCHCRDLHQAALTGVLHEAATSLVQSVFGKRIHLERSDAEHHRAMLYMWEPGQQAPYKRFVNAPFLASMLLGKQVGVAKLDSDGEVVLSTHELERDPQGHVLVPSAYPDGEAHHSDLLPFLSPLQLVRYFTFFAKVRSAGQEVEEAEIYLDWQGQKTRSTLVPGRFRAIRWALGGTVLACVSCEWQESRMLLRFSEGEDLSMTLPTGTSAISAAHLGRWIPLLRIAERHRPHLATELAARYATLEEAFGDPPLVLAQLLGLSLRHPRLELASVRLGAFAQEHVSMVAEEFVDREDDQHVWPIAELEVTLHNGSADHISETLRFPLDIMALNNGNFEVTADRWHKHALEFDLPLTSACGVLQCPQTDLRSR
jgi:hypothetical protein